MTDPNKERLRLWTDALRSGKYQQATGKLKGDEGYCCLGVACMVAVENGLSLDLEDEFSSAKNLNLPVAVGEWFGLFDIPDDPVIGIDEYDGVVYATQANDDLLWSFDQIADAIDKEFKVNA